jgi:hypothetical protein
VREALLAERTPKELHERGTGRLLDVQEDDVVEFDWHGPVPGSDLAIDGTIMPTAVPSPSAWLRREVKHRGYFRVHDVVPHGQQQSQTAYRSQADRSRGAIAGTPLRGLSFREGSARAATQPRSATASA